jgi:hypothetical protein
VAEGEIGGEPRDAIQKVQRQPGPVGDQVRKGRNERVDCERYDHPDECQAGQWNRRNPRRDGNGCDDAEMVGHDRARQCEGGGSHDYRVA